MPSILIMIAAMVALHLGALAHAIPRDPLPSDGRFSAQAVIDTIPRDQTVIAGEYFINSDPGVGNGIAISATFGTPELDATLNLSGLSNGDVIYVRFKSSDGRWSNARGIIYRVPFPQRDNNVVGGEYFVNNDPGRGNGTAFDVTTPTPEISATFSPAGLSNGDVIYTRTKSTNGLWGEARGVIYRVPYPQRDNNIVAAEYFVNADPGTGNGISIPVNTPSPDLSTSINPPGLNPNDVIYVRFRSTNGVWCRARAAVFRTPIPVHDNTLLAGEYFLNSDPGLGNATPIIGSYGFASVAASINFPTVTEGDIIYTRFKSSNGLWGASRALVYRPPLPTRPNVLLAGEYFIGSDPGVGNATPITAAYGSDSVRLTLGFQSLPESSVVRVRFKSSNLLWGPFSYIKHQAPSLVSLAYPSNGAMLDTKRFSFRWRPANGARSYRLQVSRDLSFTAIDLDTSGIRDTTLQVDSLRHNEEYFWRVNAAGDSGISAYSESWKFRIVITSIAHEASQLPSHFTLSQNYPNPFNPTTNFRFAIAESRMVTLKVYDVLGQEVASLVNEQKPPGEYSVSWDGSRVASGVYYYRMTAGSYTSVMKMLLLK